MVAMGSLVRKKHYVPDSLILVEMVSLVIEWF